MIKKLLKLVAFLSLGACSSIRYEHLCPNVIIPRDTAYSTQVADYSDDFQIELTGYEGYCYYDKTRRSNYASIMPVFSIKRLKDSSVTEVDVNFYTQTVKGPPAYLGKKTYYLSVTIPENEKEITYTADSVEVKIPPEMKYEFDINLGLYITPEEAKYNQRTFDIDYRYVDE